MTKSTFLCNVLLALTFVITPVFVVSTIPAVSAQDSSDSGEKRKTRKTPSMSEKVYKKLTEAQELIEAKDYVAGLAALSDLASEPKLSNYEKAQLYNYFAYTYFTLERYEDAIASYEQVLAQPDLPEALETNSLYTLAQLYFIIEDYQKAVDIINRWFTVTEKPTENAYMLLGQGYYQLEQYENSLVPLKKAYAMVKGRGDIPKQNLLLLLRVDYYNLGDYENMLEILKELVELYPKVEYWLTMAGTYSELKRLDKQMSILEMMYEAGSLQRGNQQLNLANLYMLHEAPYKAAVLLEKGMGEGKIEENIRNLRLLSQAWLQAQENEKSLPPLIQAAKLTKDGELDMRLAQAYINLYRYDEAIKSLRTAFKKGGLKRPDQANIMLGLALFETQNFDDSLEAFRAASKDKRSRKAAETWLGYVTSEKQRKKQLEESLQQRRS
ncbi:MAG: tetratricopeptide repeat protein [Gammaproteobacteria bacterium]|nr:tetratricopeptide repeat protein [Gammaproteobacteria bacterium]